MRKIGKAVTVLALMSFLCGLFGCGKAPEYTADDIKSVSMSCGHMDFSHSYSFYLRKEGSAWLLDAEFASDTESLRTEYAECTVAQADAKELLDIIESQQLIEKLRRYRKPKSKIQVMDETTYYTSILFANGESLGAATLASQELEACFYRLAEKYNPAVPEADDAEPAADKEESF